MASASTDIAARALARRGIVITRPLEQSRRLAELIEAASGHPILFPTLEIADPPDPQRLDRLIDELERFDWAIFVSPSAARRGVGRIRARRALPSRLRVAAVGAATARELRRLGIDAVLAPEHGADSEALLGQPELAEMHARSVLIFRGVGGRELLADALTERGAIVEYAQCYRRVRPQGDADMLLRAWRRGEVDALVVMSREGLDNLFDMVGASGRALLLTTPLFVPHARIGEAARTRGIAQVVVTNPGDEGVVSALAAFFSHAT